MGHADVPNMHSKGTKMLLSLTSEWSSDVSGWKGVSARSAANFHFSGRILEILQIGIIRCLWEFAGKGGRSIIFPSLNILIISKHIIFMVRVEINGSAVTKCAVSTWQRNSNTVKCTWWCVNTFSETAFQLPWGQPQNWAKIFSLYTHTQSANHFILFKSQNEELAFIYVTIILLDSQN